MKVAVVGAGATGGFLGASLARAGQDIVLIARGANLAAMRERGTRVVEADGSGEFVAHPPCTDDWSVLRGADVAFLTVKAHSLGPMAATLGESLGPSTALVTAQNGIPWWYFERHGGPLEGTTLRSVDPDGILAHTFDPARIVGCVVWPATRLVEPGVVEHVEGTRFTIGELDGERSERCRVLAATLTSAGLKCPVSGRIRRDIWLKLLGNVAFNPMSVLTRATLAQMARDAGTRRLAKAIMGEADAVARALGIEIPLTIDQRLAGAEGVGDHKTSMLQDLESGRPVELDALVGGVLELGSLLRLSLPHLESVYACARLLSTRAN